jgi:hypothetical protein
MGGLSMPTSGKGDKSMIQTARLLQDQLKLAESQAEAWKADYEDARDCHVLEFLLRTWLRLLEDIEDLDNKVRLLVLRGEAEVNAEDAAADFYQHWFQAATKTLLPFLTHMEEKGYQVERAVEFRNAYREVQGILTPDGEFFSGEQVAGLRDKAIDAHRRGETEEWEVPVS